MIEKQLYPILEFDHEKESLINPRDIQREVEKAYPNRLIITFFKDVIDQLLEEKKIVYFDTLFGENNLVTYKYVEEDILIMHGTIGCPACAGYLDELTGCGVNKVMFCGGGGVLDKDITVGKFLVVEAAIRDEGFSYHYLPPSRLVYANKDVNAKICDYLTTHDYPYLQGIVWTTDAIFRETRDRIAARKEEGALIVEMEQAGCLAVAAHRNIQYGAIIYGGDDVSGYKWDQRGWNTRSDIRKALVEICFNIIQEL